MGFLELVRGKSSMEKIIADCGRAEPIPLIDSV